jgi:hypothetical protein
VGTWVGWLGPPVPVLVIKMKLKLGSIFGTNFGIKIETGSGFHLCSKLLDFRL